MPADVDIVNSIPLPVTNADGSAIGSGAGGTVAQGVAGAEAWPVNTELPAAAALADATANPTTPLVGVALLGYGTAGWNRLRVPDTFVDLSAVTITTITTVWTPTTGKKFRLLGGTISVSAAASVLFEDNAAAATVFRTPKLAADTPYTFDLGNGFLSGAVDRVLKATASAAGAVTGTLWGTVEA